MNYGIEIKQHKGKLNRKWLALIEWQIAFSVELTSRSTVDNTQVVRIVVSYSMVTTNSAIPLNQHHFFGQTGRLVTDFHHRSDETLSAIAFLVGYVPVRASNNTKTDDCIHKHYTRRNVGPSLTKKWIFYPSDHDREQNMQDWWKRKLLCSTIFPETGVARYDWIADCVASSSQKKERKWFLVKIYKSCRKCNSKNKVQTSYVRHCCAFFS